MSTVVHDEWLTHTKVYPCPVCRKARRCKYTRDGAHHCFRETVAPAGARVIRNCPGGSIIVRFDSAPLLPRGLALPRPLEMHTENNSKSADWAAEAARFVDAITADQLNQLAAKLGVTPESLKLIRTGWASQAKLRELKVSGKNWQDGYPNGAYSFPECDGMRRVVGIAFRAPDGRKGFAKGAKRGLIIPTNLSSLPDPVLGVEGASDVAACLSMGIAAVGRPNNIGGAEELAELLQGRELLIVGENDSHLVEGAEQQWPGRDGAVRVAQAVAGHWQRDVRMAMPPKPAKDVRVWLNGHDAELSDVHALRESGKELLAQLEAHAETIAPPPPEITYEFERQPGRAKGTLTARIGERLVARDKISPESKTHRERFAADVVSSDPRLNTADVAQDILKFSAAAETAPARDESASVSRESLLSEYDESTEKLLTATDPDILAEAEAMLDDLRMLDRVAADIEAIGVVGECDLAMTIWMIGCSRLLDTPLAAIVVGHSATGKSYTIEKVAKLFPGEAKLLCTQITPNALFYLDRGRLMHRYIVAGERSRKRDDVSAEATRALREMISTGHLSKMLPVKVGNRMRTETVYQEGPIAFVESTTAARIFDEDANRCLLLGTDESSDQTQRIINAIAQRAQRDPVDHTRILAVHHAVQRRLKRVRVKVPYAAKLFQHMPTTQPEARRASGHVMRVIEAVTLVYQRQRAAGPLNHGDTIEATLADYGIARTLLVGPIGRALGGFLSEAVTNFGKRLRGLYGEAEFSTTQAGIDDPIVKARSKVNEYVGALSEVGAAELVQPGRGNQPGVWKMLKDPPEPGAAWLPELSVLGNV